MSAIFAPMFYSMFVRPAKPALVITIPMALFGLFRYWLMVEQLERGGSPTDALTSEWQLLAAIIMWTNACAWVFWPGK